MTELSPRQRARAIAAGLIRSAARADLETDLDDAVAAELRALADHLDPATRRGCADCPDRAEIAGPGAALWYVKHTHEVAGEDVVHAHHTAQHHPGNWTNPRHHGVPTIRWEELRLQLAAETEVEVP